MANAGSEALGLVETRGLIGSVEAADAMLARAVYVIGFSYPVVPKGKARIRAQISAAHSRDDLEQAIAAFAEVKKELGPIKI